MTETAGWVEVTVDECHELNLFIDDADGDDELERVDGHPVFPYLGFYWRDVLFMDCVTLGKKEDRIGFMDNNKWGFPEWRATEEQRREIVTQLRAMRFEGATVENTRSFYDYIQTLAPPNIAEIEERYMRAKYGASP